MIECGDYRLNCVNADGVRNFSMRLFYRGINVFVQRSVVSSLMQKHLVSGGVLGELKKVVNVQFATQNLLKMVVESIVHLDALKRGMCW